MRTVPVFLFLACLSPCAAEDAPALEWSLPNGQIISGNVSVGTNHVYVFDGKSETQYAIPRAKLPARNATAADEIETDLQRMIQPIRDNKEATVSQFKGVFPYQIKETTVYTLAIGNQMLAQHFHRNGKLCRIELGDENGVRNGPQVKLYPTGEICQVEFYRNGVPHGLTAKFYRNGMWLNIGTNIEGKKNGKEFFFHSNRNVAVQWNVKGSKFDGQSKHYHVNGELLGLQMWDEGVCVDTRVVLEPRDRADLDAITASSRLVEEIAKFGQLWGDTK